MIPGLVVQSAKCGGTWWHLVCFGCDVPMAKTAEFHLINNFVVYSKCSRGSTVAARPVLAPSGTSRSCT